MENNKHKRKSSIIYLFLASFTFILVAICLMLTNILVENTNPNITLIKTIDVILALGFTIIAIIILKSIYKDLIYYFRIYKKNKIASHRICRLEGFNIDNTTSYIKNNSILENGFYIIKDRSISYYIYTATPADLSLEEQINKFKSLNPTNSILILLLDSFSILNDNLNKINSYDKSYYMLEYLNKKSINQIIMINDNNTLYYYRPKGLFNLSSYKKACRLIEGINKKAF